MVISIKTFNLKLLLDLSTVAKDRRQIVLGRLGNSVNGPKNNQNAVLQFLLLTKPKE
jgi:hypothetical protein